MEPSVVVLLREVAPANWDACQRVIDAIGEVAPIPLSLFAVPRYRGLRHSSAFDESLGARLQAGDELGLHGYVHQEDGPTPHLLDAMRRRWHGGQAEFRALDAESAALRLRAGQRWFEHNRWPLRGFMAPGWCLSRGTWTALQASGLEYVVTLDGLQVLGEGRTIETFSVRQSHGSRLARAGVMAWNALPGQIGQDGVPLVRIELQPGDADDAATRHAWQRILARQLRYRRALTLSQVLRDLRPAGGAPAAGLRQPAVPRPTVQH
jgi:predicted deacetylase